MEMYVEILKGLCRLLLFGLFNLIWVIKVSVCRFIPLAGVASATSTELDLTSPVLMCCD